MKANIGKRSKYSGSEALTTTILVGRERGRRPSGE